MSTKKKRAEPIVIETPPPPLDSSRLEVYKEELNRRQFNNYTKRKRKIQERMAKMCTADYTDWKNLDLMYCAFVVYERENKRYIKNQAEAWIYSGMFFERMEKEEMR
jgi:hypothetical protein